MPIALAVAATALLLASLLRETQRLSRRSGFLCFAEEGGWSFERDDGAAEVLEILGSTVVTPWVVFLHARGQGAQYGWTLGAGVGDPDTFRHLRVCLRVAAVVVRNESPDRPAPLATPGGCPAG